MTGGGGDVDEIYVRLYDANTNVPFYGKNLPQIRKLPYRYLLHAHAVAH